VKIMVIPTNEELVVAREVKRFLEKSGTGEAPARIKQTPLSTQPQIA
jgi:hypothetical protein